MACPFLKEGRAFYCHAAPVGKMILEGPGYSSGGRCESREYYRCELVRRDEVLHERCPHLEEVHVQYCGVSTPAKLIPFSESRLSSCTSGGHRYCESYLALARPHGSLPAASNLLYSANHFWLDVEESGLCHVGLDAFVADVIGNPDGITFVTTNGRQRPVVAMAVHGVEWPMTFPNRLRIDRVNSHLRGDPSRMTADSYGSGWLFSGWELNDETRTGLISGKAASSWQEHEHERLLHEVRGSSAFACDGGHPVKGVGQLLPREQLVRLLQQFFGNRSWGPKDPS
jgi:glycine cleavage system H lipoate-binding protein